ncbi:MAG: amidohydrolase family protein [Actinomycetota bacterium]|nr:amidohydrolase family protein [Actinomycetota bacterium]
MDGQLTVLRAERVVAPGGILSPGEVIVCAGRIVGVRTGPRRRAPDAGTVLAPGFVDLQVNGAGPFAVPDLRTPARWEQVERLLVAGGTTTWCATLLSGPARERNAALRRAATRAALPPPLRPAPGARPAGDPAVGAPTPTGASERVGDAAGGGVGPGRVRQRPCLAGVHLEGPFLSVPGAHPPEHVRGSVPARWAAGLPAVVRIVTLAPELPGARAAIWALARRGVVVALGHSRCTADEAHAASAAGARLVTHLGNAMRPLHQRDPGLLGAGLANPSLAVSLIADLVHVHPDLARIAFAAKGADHVVLITDRVAEPGVTVGGEPPVADLPATASARERAARFARRQPSGGLTGTGAGMADMVASCVYGAGVDLGAAIAAAATTPARLLGLTDRGALEVGQRADVVELVDSGSWMAVRRVWIAGKLAGP